MFQMSEADLRPQTVGADIVYRTVVVGRLACNCTVIGNRRTKEAIVVDPGDDVDSILGVLRDDGLKVARIYHTHGHFDHILAAGKLKAAFPDARICIHGADQFWWDNCEAMAKTFGLHLTEPLPPIDVLLKGGEPIEGVTGATGTCLHTPGHTRGSICYHFPEFKLVLTGDTLFKANIGRTDLMDGSFVSIEKSIRQTLYQLPLDTKVIPGHGSTTTIEFERKFNFALPALPEGGDGGDGGGSSSTPGAGGNSPFVLERAETLWRVTKLTENLVDPKVDPRVELHQFFPDVAFVYTFANVTVVNTDEGLVLIDCCHEYFARPLRRRLRREYKGKRVHTCIYTHGHVDHVGGILDFEECATVKVVGHKNVKERFDRYKLTRGYNGHINTKQFNSRAVWPETYRYPDVYYEDALVLTVGGIRLELYHDRGETDDATWVWIPSRKTLCTGDFFIWATPNCGNPQKAQRYPLEWAAALRKMSRLNAELLLPGHGPPIIGAARVLRALSETAEFLECIVEQAMKGINGGVRLAEIVRGLKLPDHLQTRPYLQPVYDDPYFIVHNLWRHYAGWWDQDPAHLRIGHEPELAREIVGMAGSPRQLAERASFLAAEGQLDVAVQFVEWAGRIDPSDPVVHMIRARIYAQKAASEPSLMAQGVYKGAQLESEKVLKSAIWHYKEREGRVIEIATLHNRMYELAVVTSTVRWAAIKTKMFVRQLLIVLGLLHFVARLIPSLRTPSYVPGEFPPSALLEGPEAAAAEAERAHTEGPKAAGGAGSRGRRIPPPHMHGHHNCDD